MHLTSRAVTLRIHRRSGTEFGVVSNDFLQNKGVRPPKATSTGTTIVGCLFKDGIVLGADTRATEGPIVADKNCEKVRYLNVTCSLVFEADEGALRCL